jgi:23S rRNA (pseudouridine1915-N3)-methyltransferase
MKLALFYLKGKTEEWAEEAGDDYAKKISHFFSFERTSLKSRSSDRENAQEKKSAEAEALLKKLSSTDMLVLFDEGGKIFKDSEDFSRELVKLIAQKSNRLVFAIGGPYGFDESVKKRARAQWSLSGLTMNHHLAQVAALEQIYRALTIWKGLPYHNP